LLKTDPHEGRRARLVIPTATPGGEEDLVPAAEAGVGPDGGIGRTEDGKPGKGLLHVGWLIVKEVAVKTAIFHACTRQPALRWARAIPLFGVHEILGQSSIYPCRDSGRPGRPADRPPPGV